jgi:hypothetical protein
MVPGWSERERQGLHAMRQEWIYGHRRDGPMPGIRAVLRRMRTVCSSLTASGMKGIWWFGCHMLQPVSLTSQILALQTFSRLDQISRGGPQ